MCMESAYLFRKAGSRQESVTRQSMSCQEANWVREACLAAFSQDDPQSGVPQGGLLDLAVVQVTAGGAAAGLEAFAFKDSRVHIQLI